MQIIEKTKGDIPVPALKDLNPALKGYEFKAAQITDPGDLEFACWAIVLYQGGDRKFRLTVDEGPCRYSKQLDAVSAVERLNAWAEL